MSKKESKSASTRTVLIDCGDVIHWNRRYAYLPDGSRLDLSVQNLHHIDGAEYSEDTDKWWTMRVPLPVGSLIVGYKLDQEGPPRYCTAYRVEPGKGPVDMTDLPELDAYARAVDGKWYLVIETAGRSEVVLQP